MPAIGRLVLVLAALGLGGTAAASAPHGPWRWYTGLRPCPSCPDDYCAKPLPAVCSAVWRGKDDYCPKPLPGVCPVSCFGKDDYCRKPLPAVPRCWVPPGSTCGPCPPAKP